MLWLCLQETCVPGRACGIAGISELCGVLGSDWLPEAAAATAAPAASTAAAAAVDDVSGIMPDNETPER